jgi:hypothetical protein
MRSADGRFEYQDQAGEAVPPGSKPEAVHRFAYVCRRSAAKLAGSAAAGTLEPGDCWLNLRGRGHDVEKRSWTWDGNFDHPTISPSINCSNCWHGFVEKGVYLTVQKQPEPVQ